MLHRFRISLLLSVLIVSAALTTAAQEQPPCLGRPECYGTQTPSPAPSSSVWEGYSDGRLNPQMDEYYSVWCANTFLEIWRGVSSGSLLSLVPIWMLEELGSDGGTLITPNYREGDTPINVRRDGDTIMVSGDSGNLAPQPGEKSFRLSDCTGRDGHTAEERRSIPILLTTTVCYAPDSEPVRRGEVPRDQICDDVSTSTQISIIFNP
ncbi:MAG TPA: hypothetical protein VK003_12305 [Oceanobacillus sp.]|nr:hypothetical protein [Oceanobacillus sp.]